MTAPHPAAGASLGRSPFFIIFNDTADFVASNRARKFLHAAGFSVGSNQRGAPTAAMFGDYAVSKWRNLDHTERRETHAVIEGDSRNGPCRIRLLPACPDEAVRRLELAKALPTASGQEGRMSDEIRAGDVVVCVDARPSLNVSGPHKIIHGRVYRVIGLRKGASPHSLYNNSPCGLLLLGAPSNTRYKTWAAARFRKLPPASEEFTQQMRACRPAKQKEPAHA